MPEPEDVQVAREFKAALLAREAAQEAEMARRWLQVEERLAAHMAALSWEFAERRDQGKTVSEASMYRLDRYKDLRSLTEEEIMRYEREYADPLITAGQHELGRVGIDHARALIGAGYGPFDAPYFKRLPYEAVEYMAGFLGDGTPLMRLLKESYPAAMDGMVRELITGTAQGTNPRETARRMRDGLGMGLDKSLLIARTEQLRAYRTASTEQYAASGVVSKYKRISARDERTCMACLASDGEEFAVGTLFSDHPAGRCSTIPVVIGAREVNWQKGSTWFEQQDAATQKKMMGAKYYDAWKAGEFKLGDLRSTVHSDVWGDSPQVTPLAQLTRRVSA